MVKRLPVILETQVPSLGWEDPLEKGKTAHSGTLAWRIPWTWEPGRAIVHGGSKSWIFTFLDQPFIKVGTFQ